MAETKQPPCPYCQQPLEVTINQDGTRKIGECTNPDCPSNDATSLDLRGTKK